MKKFNSFKAVDGITFKVQKGEIFGLLGPNGAGKTTTIRILTGIIKPTSGTAIIGGYNIQENPIKAKQLMGIVPEMTNVYTDFTAFKNLTFMGRLYGLNKNKITKKAEQLLKIFGLYEKREQKAKILSKGLKQRLIIGMGLMNDPKILFLDEPASGLDVESTRLIRRLIRKFNDDGITILLTTHNIEEAGQLCDRIAIMNYGKIIAIERPEKLKQLIKSAISIEVAFDKKIKKDELMFNDVSRIEKIGDKFRLHTEYPERVIPGLVEYSRSTDNKIISLNTLAPNLEDIFLELTRGREK